MSGFLLDTNVISEFNRRGEPNRLVKAWLEAADTDSLYTSVLTLGEIRFGVELLPPSKRRTRLPYPAFLRVNAESRGRQGVPLRRNALWTNVLGHC